MIMTGVNTCRVSPILGSGIQGTTSPRTFSEKLPFVAPLTSCWFEREIKAGLPYDCSSDLWSLGILVLWMLDPSKVRFLSTTSPALRGS